MSEEHEHVQEIHYTVVLDDGHWWKSKTVLTFVGVSSSLKDNELLIFGKNDSFTSINFSRLLWMRAEKI